MPTRVTAIKEFPRPTKIKELQAFLGVINFYHRFVPAAAQLLLPLYNVFLSRYIKPRKGHSKNGTSELGPDLTPTRLDRLAPNAVRM